MTNSQDSPRPLETAAGIKRTTEVFLSDIKARVDKVKFEGVGRTKEDVLVNISKQLFGSRSFEDVVINARVVRDKLSQLGAFKEVAIMIDASHGADATVDGYEVTYHLLEQNIITGGVHTYIGNNNTGSLVTQLRMPNSFGRGENIGLEYQKGTKHTSGFNLTLSRPLAPWNDNFPTATAQLFQQGANAPWSHYREIDRGLMVGLSSTNLGSLNFDHLIRWEAVWRDVSALKDASFSVREEAGHTLKSSIKNILSKDTRDHTVLPTEGSLIRLEQELAGLGGNVGFHKHELELQHNVTILSDFVLQGTFKAGLMKPITQKDRPMTVTISDRFLLGGPLNLRGFKLFGVGPHSDGCALGADTYWISGLHLYTPLPFRPYAGGIGELIRTHFFVNVGTMANGNSKQMPIDVDSLRKRLRYSAGIGVVVALSGARLEFNYAYPFGKQPGDQVDSRLQFGLGINFV